jgi:hypothetical protein
MNTIPSTSKNLSVPYTVVGGKKIDRSAKYSKRLSFLVLNRGGKFNRWNTFSALKKIGADEIISVEGPGAPYDVEQLTKDFDDVRFLILHESATPGEMVNTGINECRGKFVYVLWNDMSADSVREELLHQYLFLNTLCVQPVFLNHLNEPVPSMQVPVFYRRRIKILHLTPENDRAKTLYPMDYTGIYNKERFILIGGYDGTLKNNYWQKADFGFRSYMWGEEILVDSHIRIKMQNQLPGEDTSADEDYKQFYLKNLAVNFSGDTGYIPTTRFFSFYLKTGGGIIDSYREFKAARDWVNKNSFRFKMNSKSVIDLWEVSKI